jgi:hypothetical protein
MGIREWGLGPISNPDEIIISKNKINYNIIIFYEK